MKKVSAEKNTGFPLTSQREIEILGCLRHPNIVGLIGFVVDGSESLAELQRSYKGNVYIIMEYVESTLKDLIKRSGTLSEGDVRYLMEQLLEAIKYMHKRGIVHRDLKGANILVTKRLQLKVADFGLARFLSRGNMTRKVGTPIYSAPEILDGNANYGAGIDIWSAGCIFHELLTGTKIFDGNDTTEQLKQIAKWSWTSYPCRDLKFSKTSDVNSLNLLYSMLNPNPSERITAAGALRSAFFQLQQRKRKRSP